MNKGTSRLSIQAKRRLFFIRPVCFVLIFILVVTFVSNSFTLYHLTIEKKEKEEEYLKLQEESEYLRNDITKLNNPEYIARYARENYAYSKDGEIVVKINNKKEEVKEEATDIKKLKINYNKYFIVGIILLIVYGSFTFLKRKEGK